MNTPKTTPVLCPSREELSLLADGGGDAATREHLERCTACRGVVQTYRRLDQAVGAAAAAPAYLAERIKIRCRNLPVEKPALFGGWWSLWRYPAVAAAVVLVVGVVAVSSGVLKNGAHTPTVAKAPESAAPGPAVAAAPVAPVEAVAAAPAEAAPAVPEAKPADAEVPVDPSKLRVVNLSGQGTENLAAGAGAAAVLALPLPLRTRHVWVVRDPAQSEKLLMQSLPTDAQCERLGTGNETVGLQVVLSDRALQQLVDRLAASGWSLMSPAGPQPGRGRDVLLSGRQVLYDVRLVSSR